MALGTVAALTLTRLFDLGTAAAVVTLLPTLAPAYLAWAAFQHDRAEAAIDVELAANQLAQAVKRQWDDEAAIRRLNDPYPLPVGWQAADTDVVEPWLRLAELADAWPGGPPGDPGQWPTDASGLEGADGQIGEVFSERLPTRRLVVLGEPGSGKTMLLIRLLQDLIERRTHGGQVPVLLSVASWDPAHQPLDDWLAEQLRRSHPGLSAPAPMIAPAGDHEVDLAQALLNAGRILPLLDGFDELPTALHTVALDALNRALSAKRSLVVASRTAAYHTAVAQPDAMVRLNGAAGIQLRPLAADQIAAYLRRDAGDRQTTATDRWNTVIAHLGTDTSIGQALSTPLGLFMARTIYNPRPDAQAPSGPLPCPDELRNFRTRAALDTHLFNAFIPAVYGPHQPNPPRWSAQQAHHTLAFLARHLKAHRDGSPDLAWWELAYGFPIHVRHLVLGPLLGLLFGLVGGFIFGFSDGLVHGPADGVAHGYMGGLAGDGPAAWLTIGLTAWFTIGLTVWLMLRGRRLDTVRRNTRSAGRSWSFNSLAIGLAAGFTIWFAFGPMDWLAFGIVDGSAVGLGRGLVVGLMWGLASGVVYGLTVGATVWIVGRNVRQCWSADSLAGWLAAGVVGGVPAGVVVGLTDGLSDGFAAGVAAVLAGWFAVGVMGADMRRNTPSTGLLWSSNSLQIGLAAGLTIWLVGWLAAGLTYGFAYGLAGGLISGFATGLTPENPDLTTTVGPVTLLIRDRRVFLKVVSVGGLLLGLVFGLTDGLLYGLPHGLAYGLAVGLAVGLTIGLTVGLRRTAWVNFALARIYYAARRQVPWRLMTFLQDAHEHRGVLRQVGAVYHFRHIDLQHHFAQEPRSPAT